MQILHNEVQRLLATAAQRRHRLLLCIAGEHEWAETTASQLLQKLETSALWVSDKPVHRSDCVNQNASRRWLGREVDCLIFDAHSGFDPNVFALLGGTVRAGGLLILLNPPMEQWPHHLDPVNKRCSVWGAEVSYSRYLARLASLLPIYSQILYEQPDQLRVSEHQHAPTAVQTDSEQQQLLKSVVGFFDKTKQSLDIISGDRGRGKSAALGQLAASIAGLGARDILITAPRKAAVEVLMQHAQQAWPAHAPPIDRVVSFLAPDQLCLAPRACDVLLVDEMGGIHLGLLQRLLQHYPRVLMAGTVHGYEGAGRGFHTRLTRHISAQYSHCRWHRLYRPMRWASDDPLERSCNALLMLDAEPEDSTEGELQVEFLQRAQLWANEPLLRQVYGLLAAAHYRTRPLDLRQMLDGPNLRIAIMRTEKAVVAACLIAAEGPMHDQTLNAQIVAGTRRPAGHLLPQLLMQRLALAEAAPLSYWRIVRIAVAPERQGQGIGSAFLKHIETQAQAAGVECLGSLFAVDTAVLRFWQNAGYQAVALGDNCEATSGSYALTILKPLSKGAEQLARSARITWSHTHRGALELSHPALSIALRSVLTAALAQDDEFNSGRIEG